MFDVVIAIDENEETPIYQQICHGIREAILSGRLPAGSALPSARVLSRKLGVSRFTVHHSLELLSAQGYIETNKGKGIVVGAPAAHVQAEEPTILTIETHNALSDFASSALSSQEVRIPKALQYQAPSAELLPFKTWRQLILKHLRREDMVVVARQLEATGYPPLREAIADYLSRSRSVSCQPNQIVIFPGPSAILDFISRLVLKAGDTVAVEDPGFRHSRRIFAVHGAKLFPVPVDTNGMVVADLIESGVKPKLVYLNPSAQDPTGAVLNIKRRQDLLDWAQQTGALLLEDDFGREFRYTTRPVPSLQGLARGQNVIYISSFWNVLFPLSRVSFAVFPPSLAGAAGAVRQMLERDVNLLEQFALTEFLSQGHLERYVRRMRTIYLKRRQTLIKALITRFGRDIVITQESAAMHVLIRFREAVDGKTVQIAADAAGLPLTSTEPYYMGEAPAGEFLISFAQLDEQAIEDGVAAWHESLHAELKR